MYGISSMSDYTSSAWSKLIIQLVGISYENYLCFLYIIVGI